MKVCKMSIVLASFDIAIGKNRNNGHSELRGHAHGYWLGLGFIEPFRPAANP